jgi:protein SCO1/2
MSVFSSKRRVLLAASTAVFVSSFLAGCKEEALAFHGSDINGTHLGRDLELQDGSGQTRRLSDYKGKVTLVFFGYTQCPDVCPTAMAELSQTMQLLGPDAAKVQVIMISVDPARDTPDILSAYVQAFNPSFVGLTGAPEKLSKTAKSFKAYYAKSSGGTAEQYGMDHASSFYVFDKEGESRVLIAGNAKAADIAADIRQLL